MSSIDPRSSRLHHKAMTSDSNDASAILAAKIAEYLDANKGMAAALARACDITAQSVNSWKRTGRISKRNLAKLAELSGKSISWWIDEPDSLDSDLLTEEERPLVQAWRWLLQEEKKAFLSDIQAAAHRHQRAIAEFSARMNLPPMSPNNQTGAGLPIAPIQSVTKRLRTRAK